MKSRDCSPLAKVSRMASKSWSETGLFTPFMSTISMPGSFALPVRVDMTMRRVPSAPARAKVSMLGVAEPRTTAARLFLALRMARSRAL